MKHFCIMANEEKDPKGYMANRLADSFRSKGCRAYVVPPMVPGDEYGELMLEPGTECAIILGGDGTLLRAAKLLQPCGVPIMGINLGNLGFLTALEYQDAEKAIEQLISDQYRIEQRTLLQVDFQGEIAEKTAMNDVVIARAGFSRLIRLRLLVNGQVVEDYRGDGVVIATPTGSTGYSLSAGGPVVSPMAKTLVVTPICPHMLSARPLVVSEDDVISVEVFPGSRSMEKEAQVTVDGDETLALSVGQTVTVSRSEATIPIVMLEGISFWDKVHCKL